jgi:hypothetical protein
LQQHVHLGANPTLGALATGSSVTCLPPVSSIQSPHNSRRHTMRTHQHVVRMQRGTLIAISFETSLVGMVWFHFVSNSQPSVT